MKSEFKAKFLHHLLQRKKSEQGFTLIELLVVIIIIGILAAIALPSFLNQAAKAKQSEAKNYVGSVNRAQQAYRIENTKFSGSIDDLQIGIPTETTDYKYTVSAAKAEDTTFSAAPKDSTTLRAYSGGVMVVSTTGQSSAVACQTTAPAAAAPTLNFPAAGPAACATGEVMR